MKQSVLLDTSVTLTGSQKYVVVPFTVPEDTKRLRVQGSFTTGEPAQIPLALADSRKQLRGMQVNEFSQSEASHILETSRHQGGKGCISGVIYPGRWHVIIYCRYLPETVEYRLTVTAHADDDVKPRKPNRLKEPPVLDHSKQWYCGELHLHSSESTGRESVHEVIKAAGAHGLDFIALTDHFSISHWDAIESLECREKPLVIKSMELSGERGHANLHGLHRWVNPFVDCSGELEEALGLTDWSMDHAAEAVHQQGGLFCINHPVSGRVAWRYEDFDLSRADLFEVACLPDGPPSFLYPVMWDRFILEGYRMTGIGSSDSHDPYEDGPWKLGYVRVWVYAERLSEQAILDGLRSGRVYTSFGSTRMDMHVEMRGSHNNQMIFPMGSTAEIPQEGHACLVVELWGHPKGNLFIIKDGLLVEVLSVQGDQGKREVLRYPLTHTNRKVSYVRVEFHEETVKPYYVIMAHRDHASLRAISNPVWLTRGYDGS